LPGEDSLVVLSPGETSGTCHFADAASDDRSGLARTRVDHLVIETPDQQGATDE
jgi:hypothetical protein